MMPLANRSLRLFWLDIPQLGRLAVMPWPMPDQFADLKLAGVDVVVSMLEEDEADQLGLGQESDLCAAVDIHFLHLPITDHGIPDAVPPVEVMSKAVRRHLAAGNGVAIHCFAGIGRSPLMIAAVLIDTGYSATEACDVLSAARGMTVPEMDAQYRWLQQYELRTHR